jgi:AraC-like DNA-binding protein
MKEIEQQHLIFKSISELVKRLGLPSPTHPLVALINYNNVKISTEDAGKSFLINFYKVSFKKDFTGQVKYGQGYYDFEEGGLAFLAPNQMVIMSHDENRHQGYSLFFHPDLIRNYQLGKNISKYGFFNYAVNEALFLSGKEKEIIQGLFTDIATELDNNIDHFSQDVLVSQIELLLNYSNRFYNRQFITRKVIYSDLVNKIDLYLLERFDKNEASLAGLPTVHEVSDRLNVSPRFLTDMLKSLTGQSTQRYIHNRLIEKAKDILSTTDLSIAEIAYRLGFEHPQSFNKLFKQKTNTSPIVFRHSFDN